MAVRHYVSLTSTILSTILSFMKIITYSYAQDHFSEILKRVEQGERIVIKQGKKAIAKLIPVKDPNANAKPVSEIIHKLETFSPLSDDELLELGIED